MSSVARRVVINALRLPLNASVLIRASGAPHSCMQPMGGIDLIRLLSHPWTSARSYKSVHVRAATFNV